MPEGQHYQDRPADVPGDTAGLSDDALMGGATGAAHSMLGDQDPTAVDPFEARLNEILANPPDINALSPRLAERFRGLTPEQQVVAFVALGHEAVCTEAELVQVRDELEQTEAELEKAKDDSIVMFNKIGGLRHERDQYKERAELAVIDDLTGISNRRGLNEAYDTLVKSAEARRQSNHTDSVLFIDLDKFKDINTRLGQDGGDEVLKIVAKCLDEIPKREGDTVGRWGGDEFIMLLPDMPKEKAAQFAEEVRTAIESLRAMPVLTTASIGVDTVDRSKTLQKAARYAGDAMKEAKENGRNQVVVVNGNPESGY